MTGAAKVDRSRRREALKAKKVGGDDIRFLGQVRAHD
jgi:hypothetical protein